jgi:hypothetical protein
MKRRNSQLWLVFAALLGMASLTGILSAGSAPTSQGRGNGAPNRRPADIQLCTKLKARPVAAEGGAGTGPRGRVLAELTSLGGQAETISATEYDPEQRRNVQVVKRLEYDGSCVAGWEVYSSDSPEADILRKTVVRYEATTAGVYKGGVKVTITEWAPLRPTSMLVNLGSEARMTAERVALYDAQFRLRTERDTEGSKVEQTEYYYNNAFQPDRVSTVHVYNVNENVASLVKKVSFQYDPQRPNLVTAEVATADLVRNPDCAENPQGRGCATQWLYSYDDAGRRTQVVSCGIENEQCRDPARISSSTVYSRFRDAGGKLVTRITHTRVGNGGAYPPEVTSIVEK